MEAYREEKLEGNQMLNGWGQCRIRVRKDLTTYIRVYISGLYWIE